MKRDPYKALDKARAKLKRARVALLDQGDDVGRLSCAPYSNEVADELDEAERELRLRSYRYHDARVAFLKALERVHAHEEVR